MEIRPKWEALLYGLGVGKKGSRQNGLLLLMGVFHCIFGDYLP